MMSFCLVSRNYAHHQLCATTKSLMVTTCRTERRSFSNTTTRITSYDKYLSSTSRRRKPSAIRRLQPLVSQPGMISLGGGLPNPKLFPITELRFSVKDPLDDNTIAEISLTDEDELRDALQYSPTSGVPGLRQQLVDLQQREHARGSDDDTDVTVTVGSQDGFCKAVEMLVDPEEDVIFLETPTYSGALSFLQPFGAKLVPVETDSNGLLPSEFERALEKERAGSTTSRRRVLYTVPTAQNPSGATLSQGRRQEIYELAQKYDVIILEDDPYWFLHPNRGALQSFLSLDTDGRVLRFDSMSKVISSGLRIGFATGPSPLIEKLNFHIQATNLHNSGVSQVILQKILEKWGEEGLNEHCKQVADFYCQRRDVLLTAANKHLDGLAEWNSPEAGMFLWLKLRGITDTKALIEEKAAKANILLVPGQSFCPLDLPSPYVRASFSTASDSDMDAAMERLAELIISENC